MCACMLVCVCEQDFLRIVDARETKHEDIDKHYKYSTQ